MLISRTLYNPINDKLAGEPRVIVVYGPRQSGKTVLLGELIKGEARRVLFLRGDNLQVQTIFGTPVFETINSFIGNSDILVIDEAQKIDHIGASLKLLFDARPMPILVSGSSSFDLADKLAEPMTGRATFFTLYPLSVAETATHPPKVPLPDRMDALLRFGMYPKVHTMAGHKEKEEYLYDVINTYLYNDLLTFREIKKPKKVIDVLELLAHQIGSEVNILELAQSLQLNRLTVEKYLDILEKMFVIVQLRGFSRNLRKEISKTSKYYFVDLGIRNAVIRNFNPLRLRGDTGTMFENFCFMERVKALGNARLHANTYFWRTYDRKEIDLIEEAGGKLSAFEFKWSKGKTVAAAREFLATYPESSFREITPNELETFLTSTF